MACFSLKNEEKTFTSNYFCYILILPRFYLGSNSNVALSIYLFSDWLHWSYCHRGLLGFWYLSQYIMKTNRHAELRAEVENLSLV